MAMRRAATNDAEIRKAIGARINRRRLVLGMTQSELGSAIGVSFQQIQKYELGTNRISAETLLALGEALDVDIHYFVESVQSLHDGRSAADQPGADSPGDLRFLGRLKRMNPRVRARLIALVKALTDDDAPR